MIQFFKVGIEVDHEINGWPLGKAVYGLRENVLDARCHELAGQPIKPVHEAVTRLGIALLNVP